MDNQEDKHVLQKGLITILITKDVNESRSRRVSKFFLALKN